jgi:hypothetical protein
MKEALNFIGLGLLTVGAGLAGWEIYRTPAKVQLRLPGLIAPGLIFIAFLCQFIALFL